MCVFICICGCVGAYVCTFFVGIRAFMRIWVPMCARLGVHVVEYVCRYACRYASLCVLVCMWSSMCVGMRVGRRLCVY